MAFGALPHAQVARRLELLTNDFSLLPGVVAFLYGRRWEQEKTHDNWKNDFAVAKAWGRSPVAIANQADLAIITTLLVHLMLGAACRASPPKMRRRCASRIGDSRGSRIRRGHRAPGLERTPLPLYVETQPPGAALL